MPNQTITEIESVLVTDDPHYPYFPEATEQITFTENFFVNTGVFPYTFPFRALTFRSHNYARIL